MIVIQTVYPPHENQLNGRKKLREITCISRTCPHRESMGMDTSSYFLRMQVSRLISGTCGKYLHYELSIKKDYKNTLTGRICSSH